MHLILKICSILFRIGIITAIPFLFSCASQRIGSVNINIRKNIFTNAQKAALPLELVIHRPDGISAPKPNIIIILTDDMGYGDIGCYGSTAITTPYIDQLADEGVRFTDFYCSSPLCSPSRAGLLTGRYPLRSGITFPIQPGEDTFMRKTSRRLGYRMGALGVYDLNNAENLVEGLPHSEITIAEALQIADYNTAAIGKWHLGDYVHEPDYHPHNYGFDYFCGFNASNDDWPVAFWRDQTEIEKDIGLDQSKYTCLFTQEVIKFIDQSGNQPFFIYMAHKDPHQPCFPSEDFAGLSEAGPHGDTVQEVDWSVKEIIEHLEKRNLEHNTLILFTSDNGPWFDGSTGGLRGRKGESYEGGYRVPMIAWWPGTIPAGRVSASPAMNIDFFPTILHLAGLEVPNDRVIDGKDISAIAIGRENVSPHDALFFFHYNEIEGVRSGQWKFFRNINTRAW